MKPNLFTTLIFLLFTNISFAGEEILIKVTCAPELALFSIQAVSVFSEYDSTHEELKEKYAIVPYPTSFEGAIHCKLSEKLFYEIRPNDKGEGLLLLISDQPLLREFSLWHGGFSFFPKKNRINLLSISSASISVCGTDSHMKTKCGDYSLIPGYGKPKKIELTLDEIFGS